MRINLRPSQLIFSIFILISQLTYSSNYVKVATIGKLPSHIDESKGFQYIVDRVIDFWNVELNKVLPDQPDLIVLPEACDRPAGLTKDKHYDYFKFRGNQVLDFFSEIAKTNNCYIVFGTKRQQDDGIWRNSSILIDRQGNIAGIYNKNFPTISEIEGGITPGTEAAVFNCDFGKIACVICYDLNFTELCDQYAMQKPDILVFSSMYHGGIMQEYWAYQCRSFFIGAMGSGNIPSEIRNPLGQVVASNTNYFSFTVTTINLDRCLVHLDNNWAKLYQLNAKYGEQVIITDPGKLGPVMISSEHPEITALDMAKEFDIELLDSYFARSRKACNSNNLNSKTLTDECDRGSN